MSARPKYDPSDIPIPTSRIPSHMGTDLQYLTYLANEVGYVFYIDPDPLPGIPIPRELPVTMAVLPERSKRLVIRKLRSP